MRKVLLSVVIIVSFLFLFVARPWADELDNITRQLESLKADLKGKEANYDKLNKQIEGIRARVAYLGGAIVKKEQEVEEGEKDLSHQRDLLNQRAQSYYKNISKNELSLINVLASPNLSTSLGNFFYQKTLSDQDKNSIIKIVLFIKSLEEKKAQLVNEKARLAVIKEEVDKQSKVLAGEISGTKQKVAQLTAQQQSLIAAKLASIYVPRSAGTSTAGCSSDLTNGKNPGFSPRIGFFTYGAPHGNGMNQYGAKGRADAGQNVDKILQEYYPGLTLKKDYDQNVQVNVEGNGTFSIEDYTKRIYEVPGDWPMETLKAQAVAARSYALNSMQRNGSICTSEACQVFKPEPKGGNWEQAVEATKGWVLMDGGNPGFTQYASTHGGYIRNLGKFDGDGGNPGSFADVNARAYDRASPWFYCDWGSRSEYGGTAWLKQAEVADIANAILLAKRDSSAGPHLSPPDKGGDAWDAEKVKSELGKYRGAFNNVSGVSIGADFGSGVTTSVTVSGDAGSETFSGQEWKDWFNLRAPANIQIKNRLYNVEIQ